MRQVAPRKRGDIQRLDRPATGLVALASSMPKTGTTVTTVLFKSVLMTKREKAAPWFKVGVGVGLGGVEVAVGL